MALTDIMITDHDSAVLPQRRSSLPLAHSACPRPIPNSYWATPNLLACEYPWSPFESSTQKLDKILAAGVRTFIDLTESGELSPYAPHLPTLARAHSIPLDEIEYHQFPIQDRSLPESREFMFTILDVLRDNERRGRASAVHCRGGIGRTGMVIGCWLVESAYAKNGEEALRIIASLWKTVEKCKRYPHSPETGPQHEFVKNFEPPRMVLAHRAGFSRNSIGGCVLYLIFSLLCAIWNLLTQQCQSVDTR